MLKTHVPYLFLEDIQPIYNTDHPSKVRNIGPRKLDEITWWGLLGPLTTEKPTTKTDLKPFHALDRTKKSQRWKQTWTFYHPFQLTTWNLKIMMDFSPSKKKRENHPSLGTSAHKCSMGHFTGRQFFVLGVLEIFWEDGKTRSDNIQKLKLGFFTCVNTILKKNMRKC